MKSLDERVNHILEEQCKLAQNSPNKKERLWRQGIIVGIKKIIREIDKEK